VTCPVCELTIHEFSSYLPNPNPKPNASRVYRHFRQLTPEDSSRAEDTAVGA